MASPLPPAMTVLEFVRQILRLLVAVAPSPYIHIYLKTARAMNTSMWMIQRLRFNHLLFDATLLWLHLSVCIYVASSWIKKQSIPGRKKREYDALLPLPLGFNVELRNFEAGRTKIKQTLKQHWHWGTGWTDETRKTSFPLLPPMQAPFPCEICFEIGWRGNWNGEWLTRRYPGETIIKHTQSVLHGSPRAYVSNFSTNFLRSAYLGTPKVHVRQKFLLWTGEICC